MTKSARVVGRWLQGLAAWLLPTLYALFGLANLVRGVLALRVATVFDRASLALSLPVLGVLYLFWAFAFLGVAVVLLWQFGRRFRLVTLGVAWLYQLTTWALRIWAVRSSPAQHLWARDLLLSIVFLAIATILGLCLPHGHTRGPQE